MSVHTGVFVTVFVIIVQLTFFHYECLCKIEHPSCKANL